MFQVVWRTFQLCFPGPQRLHGQVAKIWDAAALSTSGDVARCGNSLIHGQGVVGCLHSYCLLLLLKGDLSRLNVLECLCVIFWSLFNRRSLASLFGPTPQAIPPSASDLSKYYLRYEPSNLQDLLFIISLSSHPLVVHSMIISWRHICTYTQKTYKYIHIYVICIHIHKC